MNAALDGVIDELGRARMLHLPIISIHEALGVIREEYCEFEACVFVPIPDPADLLVELLQLAAMCVRTIEDLGLVERADTP